MLLLMMMMMILGDKYSLCVSTFFSNVSSCCCGGNSFIHIWLLLLFCFLKFYSFCCYSLVFVSLFCGKYFHSLFLCLSFVAIFWLFSNPN
jgi:hypothetical protein